MDMASYVHDNTPYTFASEVDATLKRPKISTINIFDRLHKNHL